MTPLTLIPGGRNQAEIVAVDRGDLEELQMENAALRSEHATFVAHARQYVRSARLSLNHVQPDADSADRWLTRFDQITERELARIRAAEIERPTPLARAA